MNIETKEIEYCKLEVSYTADNEEISNKRDEVLRIFQKAQVPGFRKGKSTLDAIKVYYRTQIEEALKRALAEEAYHNTLFEKKLSTYGTPNFLSIILEKNKFTCDFEIFIKPSFELDTYKDFEVPKPHEQMSSQEIAERMMQDLRVRFGSSQPYGENDFVQKGDNVIVDYVGFLNGEKLDSLCAQGEMISVGNSKLTCFDDNILGMTIGENREFDLVVPDDGLPSFSGKTIHFSVTLIMGAKHNPCPLNDELAAKVGKNSFAELKELVCQSAMARFSENSVVMLNNAISRKLLDTHQFKVPNWLSLAEAKFITKQAKIDWEKLADVDREKYMEIAENNVKLSLILDKIRDSEPEAQLSDQEVLEIIKENITKTKTEAAIEDIIKEMSRNGYLQILSAKIKDEYTLNFVSKTVKVIE
jgi:trigger factor